MSATAQMLDAHPLDVTLDQAKLAACIDACLECFQACTACADACLSEKMVGDLRECIGTNLDCADVCDTTARVLTRQTGWNVDVVRAVLEACARACDACAAECEQHASMHEHCKVCAEVCRNCEQACTVLLDSFSVA
jgi:hypothetical protein